MKVELRRDFLEANHERISDILFTLDTLRSTKNISYETLKENVEALSEIGFTENEVHTLRSEVIELLEQKNANGKPLSTSEKEKVLTKIEGLRFRVLGIALACMPFTGDEETIPTPKYTDTLDVIFQKSPIIEHFPGDVIGAKIARYFVLLLSPIQNDSDLQKVCRGLLSAFERTSHGVSWLIDFSAVGNISTLLLGIIYGYRESLRLQGGDLAVCWLADHQLPEAYRERVSTKLSLVKIGNHWFSKHAGC